MAARLGNVLYWLGCWVAVAFVAVGGEMMIRDADSRNVRVAGLVAATAFAIWLVGRACRYVLSGR